MKRLLAIAALTLGAACNPGSAGAKADPHLGTLFAENSEVNALPENQSANFVASDFAVDGQGTVHFIATWGPTRAFGETVPHFNPSTYWRVSRDGTVVKKSGPRYPSAVTFSLNVLIGPDDQPVFVQYNGLGPGKVISFFTANDSGDAWAEKPFFFSNRPEGVTERALNFATDQVRVLSNGQIALLLQNHLMRSTADGWAEVSKPPGALDFHLINADARALRVVWTEAGNRLVTATYSTADGSLDAASVVRTRLPGVPSFGANFNAAGSPDAFTLDLDLNASWATYRFAGKAWSRVDAVGANAFARVPLLLTRHPSRALRGYTRAVFLGRDTGIVGALQPGLLAIKCPVQPKRVMTTTGDIVDHFPDSEDARLCSDRQVDVRMKPEPDLSGMVLVTFDRTQDIVTRGYVKHVPFPVAADPFYADAGTSPIAFPGDDGGTDANPNQQTRLRGRVQLVGQSMHSGIQGTLQLLASTSMTQPLEVNADGTYASSEVVAGQYQLTFSTPGYTSSSAQVTVTPGLNTLADIVLDVEGITDARFDLTASNVAYSSSKLYQLKNTELTVTDFGFKSRKVIGTAVVNPVSTFATQNGDVLIGWASGATQARFTAPGADVASSYDQVSLPDFRLMGTSAPVVANGPVDGVTPRDWKQGASTLITGAVDVAFGASNTNCTTAYQWAHDAALDGGIRLSYRMPCTSGPFAPIIGPAPQPPLTFGVAEYKALVFEGANCGEKGGYLTPCKLFLLNNNGSTLVSNQAVDYRSPRLDRAGNTGTAYFDNGTLALSNLSLPARYPVGERPAYSFSGGSFAVRTTTGFTYASSGRPPVSIAANVVRSFEVPGGIGFYSSAAPGAADCTSGCSLETVTPMFNSDPVRRVVQASASGDEEVVFSGAGYRFLANRTWADCPGGACGVVVMSQPDGGTQALTRGALLAWPAPGPVVRPAAFVRVNADGGAGLASSVR